MVRDGWGDDNELLSAMGDALGSAGTVPRSVILSGRAAWTWRTIDDELATLVFDSFLEDAASVRGDQNSAARLLIFEGADGAAVEFEVGEDGLVGQLLPPNAGQVSLVSAAGGAVEAVTDDVGCFVLPLPEGPFRLVCRTRETTFSTDWVHL
jgi:hypothetical protein